MITWTQGGTTKSINNNNIVYAKQGADGEPVLIDRIIAVDTSTNPPTESVVYQNNSILRATGISNNIEGPSMTGGQSRFATGSSTTDYYWIMYPTLYNQQNIGTAYGTLDTYGASSSAGGIMGIDIKNVPASANRYHPTVPVNVQYTYTVPYRVVVKVRPAITAIGMRITTDNGWNTQGWGGQCNSYTSEQILYDGLMDNTTRDYNFNCTLELCPFSVRVSTSRTGQGTNKNFTANDSRKWVEMRMRGNLLIVPAAISRTIEIYDPVTGDLIASNTSALSSTWTARAS